MIHHSRLQLLEDRPWKERPVLGTVRYMNAKGLERKYDTAAYVRRVKALTSAAQLLA